MGIPASVDVLAVHYFTAQVRSIFFRRTNRGKTGRNGVIRSVYYSLRYAAKRSLPVADKVLERVGWIRGLGVRGIKPHRGYFRVGVSGGS